MNILSVHSRHQVIRIAFFICLYVCHSNLYGQVVQGTVSDHLNNPLPGASVHWMDTQIGTTTDSKGYFELQTTGIEDYRLIASFVGHKTDTMLYTGQSSIKFRLEGASQLEEVVVQDRKEGVIISNELAIKTEQITQSELKKAACCDLAGCFETQTTVQPQTTNVVTNAKELRILGLSGVYNQILIDGLPMIQGLTYTYGISSIPGPLVDNIFVAKGANSVLQGFESISGQINVETKDPTLADRVFLNTYMNNFGEKHFNAQFSNQVGKWHQLSGLHAVLPANRIDRDDDQFLDLPLLTRLMGHTRWQYGAEDEKGWHHQIGLRFLNEKRIGGQVAFDPDIHLGGSDVYGQSVQINQPEMWAKTGYRFNKNQRIAILASGFLQDQRSFFGTTRYQAQQANFYANIQFEQTYKQHDLKTGVSYRYLNLSEDLSFTEDPLNRSYAGLYQRTEQIPGVFAENTMRFFKQKLTWILGFRADHHNTFGAQLTPRSLVKYDVSKSATIRANVGTGWRTVNFFPENIGLLVSSRDIIFLETLQPERAINSGINFTQNFETTNQGATGFISVDFYRTQFQNQIFPDYDSDPTKAFVDNFTGTCISNGFQAEVFARFAKKLEVKAGYNFLDVYREIEGEKILLPFNPRHKILGMISYKPESGRFQVDLNAHWYGLQRLPNTQQNPEAYQRPDFSETFTLINAQFSWYFNAIDVYVGCENVFDFRQLQPIISWENPFGQYFDTSSVWGPTRGRELYAGIRYRIKKK
jgi:outer membrane receptor for ferrienterochelin and colicins